MNNCTNCSCFFIYLASRSVILPAFVALLREIKIWMLCLASRHCYRCMQTHKGFLSHWTLNCLHAVIWLSRTLKFICFASGECLCTCMCKRVIKIIFPNNGRKAKWNKIRWVVKSKLFLKKHQSNDERSILLLKHPDSAHISGWRFYRQFCI